MYFIHSPSLVLLLLLHFPPCTPSTETALNTHLQTITNKLARPVTNHTKPLNVTFGFELIHIVRVTESEQTMNAKVWLRMIWVNELMKWEPSKWGGVKMTRMNFDTVWTPDIFLQEDVGEELSAGPEAYKTPITCNHDGTHQWLIPALLTSSCMFDVENFPYDRQYCYLKFVSWTFGQNELDIKPDSRPIVTSNYINSSEWQLMNVSYTINVKKYNCCPHPFVDIRYAIRIDRMAMYYIYNAVVPCIIQMIIILFTFFLPPDSGERIGVVITVLLVFAVYLEVISGNLPKTSHSVPALSKFYIAAMAISSFSLIATCFVLVVHFKGTEKGITPMPDWTRRIFLQKIGRYLGIGRLLRVHKNEDLLALESKGTYGGLAVEDDTQIDNSTYPKNVEANNAMLSAQGIISVIKEVRVITKLIDDQNLQDEIEEEWQTLAKVMDRIFFLVFLFVFVVTSLVILLPVYLHYLNTHFLPS